MVAISILTLGALFAQAWAIPTAVDSATASATPTAASTSLPIAESQLADLAGLAYNTTIDTVSSDSDITKREEVLHQLHPLPAEVAFFDSFRGGPWCAVSLR
ncbi:hypothetical protein DTO012A9_10294 [Penicillium roqueforti]|nr:hypothetical protein DTO012A9_10294 [Penicillium roqueforti]